MATIPLYVRAGSILPLGPVKQFTAEKSDAPLSLAIHPGADGKCVLYDDDGSSFDFRKGDFLRVEVSWNDRNRRLSMRLADGSRPPRPEQGRMVVHVAGETGSREVTFKGPPLDVRI